MILGIGIDLIEVDRIRETYRKFGDRFMRRILLSAEMEYCMKHSDPGPFLAARFAAKEAVSKAFGTGIGAQLGWKDMEVIRLPSGQPTIALHGLGLTLMTSRRGRVIHVSLTHTAQHASAIAILED